jgi:Tfp pilus assembly protein PilF
VKVLDFGIAKSAEVEETAKNNRRLTRPGVAMGTPEYMAPEQAAGKPADPRSDIYAVGSILYEMLTGNAPYDGDNVMEVLHKKANHAPAPLRAVRPEVPASVEELVNRAMARSPVARPQSMGALAAELRALGASLAGEPTPPPAVISPRRSRRESPLLPGTVAEVAPTAAMWGLSRRTVAAMGGALVLVAGLVVVRATTRGRAADRVVPAASSAPDPAQAPAPVAPEPPVVYGPPEPPATSPRTEAEEPSRRPGRTGRRAGALAQRRKLMQEAYELYRAQRFDDARAAFSRLLAEPRPPDGAYLGLARVAFQQGKYDEAIKLSRQGVRAGGGAEAWVLLGDVHYRQQRFREARDAYREALKKAPSHESARRMLGLVERKLR